MATSIILEDPISENYYAKGPEVNTKGALNSLIELQEYGNISRAPENIPFDYKLLKALITKPEKTVNDCRQLIDQLRFFGFPKLVKESISEFNEEKLLDLAKYLKIERYHAGTPLYVEGEFCSARMYMILSGEVTETKKKIDPVTKMILSSRSPNFAENRDKNILFSPSPRKSKPAKKELKVHTSLMRSNSLKRVQFESIKLQQNSPSPGIGPLVPSRFDLDIDDESINDLASSPNNKKMMTLKKVSLQGKNTEQYTVERRIPGEYLGEEIITGVSRRRVTAFVSAPSELIIVKLEDIRHVENVFENRLIDISNFLREVLPFVEKLGYPDLKRNIIPYLVEKKYDRGAILTQEGKEGHTFYILKEGECEAFKNYVKEHDNQRVLQPALDNLYQHEKKIEHVSLYYISRSVIGEECLFNEDSKYEVSVKVVSQGAIVYTIEKRHFYDHFPEDTIKGMRRLLKNKKTSNKRIVREKFDLIEETIQKAAERAKESSPKNKDQVISPRASQAKLKKYVVPYETVPEVQTPLYTPTKSYLKSLNPNVEIQTLSEKFKDYTHSKWHSRSSSSMANSTQTKATIIDTASPPDEPQSDNKEIEKYRFEFREMPKPKSTYFSGFTSHRRADSQKIVTLTTTKSPRADAVVTLNSPKVSKQLNLIQNQTQKLLANPGVLSFQRNSGETNFAQTVKIFPKPGPHDQLKNYLLEGRISNKILSKDNNLINESLSPSRMEKSTPSFHNGRVVQVKRKSMKVNVVEGVFYE